MNTVLTDTKDAGYDNDNDGKGTCDDSNNSDEWRIRRYLFRICIVQSRRSNLRMSVSISK